MKVRDVMTKQVIPVGAKETVAVAARSLTHYNIGALPVIQDGNLCGLLTDRDIVTRCLAANRDPNKTTVEQIMSVNVHGIRPDAEVYRAALLMGKLQVRRLPVLDHGKLCGMISLGDLAGQEESVMDAAEALVDISNNICE